MKKFSHELGGKFSWVNPVYTNQRGWELNQELRSFITNGTIKYLIIALDSTAVKTDGGLGGIEIILNSQKNGISLDYKSFPWNWETSTQTGGYISYIDLIKEGHAYIDSGNLFLNYNITQHPSYSIFKTEMSSADWGQISIQYGIGMRIFPFVTAYLKS